MSNKPFEYGAAGIYRSAEPTLVDGEGSALALSSKGNAWMEVYPWQVKVETDDTYTYVAVATPGTSEDAAAWRVYRTDSDGNLLYADGNELFDNVATDLTTLDYSYS